METKSYNVHRQEDGELIETLYDVIDVQDNTVTMSAGKGTMSISFDCDVEFVEVGEDEQTEGKED